MGTARTIFLSVYYVVCIVCVGIVGIPRTLITGRVDWLYWTAMKVALGGIKLIGIKVDVQGMDQFNPKGTYIYMCNHVSNLDPPIVVPLIPRRSSVLVKKELFRVPILARAMLLASFVPVDRRNREAAIASVERAVEVLQSGINITVFPEGTRSHDGRLKPFKKGPFHLAMECGAPIIPMTIHGTETMMPKKGIGISAGTATLVFHAPVDPKKFSSREELMAAVHRAVASALPEHMKPVS
ncbi:MAG: 1-acyl-sn-glycerol-3-phosphate acyltransferase [Acidobacteriales bacterium]|nr:1-acyl-sn-glycerol-3-phosphate acyltransferase [Terriglobales bacterium]